MKEAWKLSESGLNELYDNYYRIDAAPTNTSEDQTTKPTIVVTRSEVGSKERMLLSGILKAIHKTTEDCTMVSPEDYQSLHLSPNGHTLHFEPKDNSNRMHTSILEDNHTVVHCQTLTTYLSDVDEKKTLWQLLKDTFKV